jgi:predicted transcriptional regulator
MATIVEVQEHPREPIIGSNRTRYEIIYQILSILRCRGRLNKTALQTFAGVNGVPLNKYLAFMVDRQLVTEEREEDGHFYALAGSNALDFMAHFEAILVALREVDP